MGRTAAWGSLWGQALLAASILSSCFLLTEGQTTTEITIRVQPKHPIQGQDVTLTPEGLLEKALRYSWYRGGTDETNRIFNYFPPPTNVQNNGPAFTERETVGSDGSLHIRNLTSKDTGNYTLLADTAGQNVRGTTSFTVSGSGGNGSGLGPGAIAGIVIGSLLGVALVVVLLYFICTKTSFGRMELPASNGNVPSAPGHNQGVTDTKPKAAEEDLQYSILAFKDNNCSPPLRPTSQAPQASESVTIYSEIKKK